MLYVLETNGAINISRPTNFYTILDSPLQTNPEKLKDIRVISTLM